VLINSNLDYFKFSYHPSNNSKMSDRKWWIS